MPNKEAVLAEINRVVPEQFKGRPGFVMTLYNTSIFEEYIDFRGFTYTAVNNETGKTEIVERRKTPLLDDEKKLVKFALKVRETRVSELGRLEIAEGVSLNKLKAVVRELFREILPKYDDFKIREEQIALAEELLESIAGRQTLLAEAPTGLGKTLVYIIIGLLTHRAEMNKTFSGSFFPGMSCVEWLRMSNLVSTSSIALQKAIRTDVIPKLSKIFEEWGIIREPITAVLRKGKEHYVCEYNLNEYLLFEEDPETKEELERLEHSTDISLADPAYSGNP